MALHIRTNNVAADGPVVPQVHTRFAMYFDNARQIAFADSFFELMCAVSSGYETLTEQWQRGIRVEFATSVAPIVQSNAIDSHLEEHDQAQALTDYAHLRQDDGLNVGKLIVRWCTTYSTSELVLACELGNPHKICQPSPQSVVPNVSYLCPGTEESLLRSLHEWGIVKIMINEA